MNECTLISQIFNWLKKFRASTIKKMVLIICFMVSISLVHAQFLPSPQLCNPTNVSGSASGRVEGHGHFELSLNITCDPNNKDSAFPQGSLTLFVNTNDPQFEGNLIATTIEGTRTIGHVAPMAVVSGQCEVKNVRGCRFWLFMADNDHNKKGTPDTISFLILDSSGREIAYASAPTTDSTITVRAER